MSPKPFESRIQDLVYNVDVGIGLKLIKFGLYVLAVMALMLMYTVTQFKNLDDAEAMDLAQVGRNLLERKSFTTQYVRPASMWYMIEKSRAHNPRIEQHPDIVHPPVYPALLAAGYKITGAEFSVPAKSRTYPAERWVIVPVGHLFTLLTGILVFLLGLHLFDRKVAWLGVTMYFLSNTVWADSVAGLGVPLVTFFVTLSLYMMLLAGSMEQEGQPWKRWITPYIVSILACVLAFLTRYGAVVLLPGLVLLTGYSFKRRSWLLAGIVAAGFLLGVTPWLARNVMVSGGPLGVAPYLALNNSNLFDENLFTRSLAPTFAWKQVVSALSEKWLVNVARFYNETLPSMGDGLVIALFITTFFYRFMRRRVHVLRWSVAASAFCLILVAGFFGDRTIQLLHVFWPVIILYGLAFFFILLDRLNLRVRLLNIAVTVVFFVLAGLPLLFALLPPRQGIPYPPYFQPYIHHVTSMIDSDELMCSDMPWATAWYGRCNSLEIPATLDDFYEINDYIKRVSGMYITTVTRNQPYVRTLLTGKYQSWFPILEGRIPADFPLTEGFPIANRDQMFLTDRKRWLEQEY